MLLTSVAMGIPPCRTQPHSSQCNRWANRIAFKDQLITRDYGIDVVTEPLVCRTLAEPSFPLREAESRGEARREYFIPAHRCVIIIYSVQSGQSPLLLQLPPSSHWSFEKSKFVESRREGKPCMGHRLAASLHSHDWL